jgi:sulfatase maturation enzyme AslB (radical SAM superfamily)
LLFGGEPLLLGEQLYQYIRTAAAEFPRTNVSIITNGYWATTQARTQKILGRLKEAGLTHLALSYDAFHAAHTPPGNIQRILDALSPMTMRKTTVDTHYLFGEEVSNDFNDYTMRLIHQLQIPSFVEHSRFKVRIVGRMADHMSGGQPIDTFAESPCQVPFWVGPSLANPTSVEIDPSGHVTLCPGICIGNLTNTPLKALLANYIPNQHPIVAALHEQGIDGLIQLAREHNVYDKRLQVNSACHACYELRRVLQPIYPMFLAPPHIYQSCT